jgi:3-hydroxybutyryl-CoA dehydrogenase
MTERDASAPSLEAARVAVIGAGTMGAGIAQVALEGGWRVSLHDPVPGATDRALERIRQGLTRRAEKAGTADPGADAARKLLALDVQRDVAAAAAGAQLAIEAVVEDLALKRRLFGELDDAASPDTLLATNTSALSVTSIAEAASRPERVVGLHFFNPAPLLPLVEVVVPLTVPVAVVVVSEPVVVVSEPVVVVSEPVVSVPVVVDDVVVVSGQSTQKTFILSCFWVSRSPSQKSL